MHDAWVTGMPRVWTFVKYWKNDMFLQETCLDMSLHVIFLRIPRRLLDVLLDFRQSSSLLICTFGR